MAINQQKKNHIIILTIFGMSFISFLIAWAMLKVVHVKGTNNGEIITPVVPTEQNEYVGFDEFSRTNIQELKGHWLIVNVIPQEHCTEICLRALLKTKQLRVMLNRDLPRTRRVAIVFKSPKPEIAEQWWLKDTILWMLSSTKGKTEESKNNDSSLINKLLSEENLVDVALVKTLIDPEHKINDEIIKKLMVQNDSALAHKSDLIRVKPSASLQKKLKDIRKSEVPDGMLFLIDPLGNIMMQYEPNFDPYKVKNDLMLLLRASQIG